MLVFDALSSLTFSAWIHSLLSGIDSEIAVWGKCWRLEKHVTKRKLMLRDEYSLMEVFLFSVCIENTYLYWKQKKALDLVKNYLHVVYLQICWKLTLPLTAASTKSLELCLKLMMKHRWFVYLIEFYFKNY